MSSIEDLVAVVDRLLDPDGGCVWNRAQTHASLARYAVEEAYELVDAIEDGSPTDLREELGDVLYQVVLHAGIARRVGWFDVEDVAATVRDKMVRRHPHVFGDERADTAEEVVRVWRAAKNAEKASRTSVLDGVPRAMPPLERAVKLLERLEERGDVATVVASLTAGREARPEPATSVAERRGPAGAGRAETEPAGTGSVDAGSIDAAWGADLLARVAEARAAGVDPIGSLRAAVAALESAGRA